jgi:hypothetical protein
VSWWADSIAALRGGDARLRPYVVYVTMVLNFALNALNLWWGVKIISGVARLLRADERGTARGERSVRKEGCTHEAEAEGAKLFACGASG